MYTFSKEDLQQNQPQKRRLAWNVFFGGKKKSVLSIGLIALVLLAGTGIGLMQGSKTYALVVNGKETLVFDSKVQAEQAVQTFLNQKSQEMGKAVTTEDVIEILETEDKAKSPSTEEDVKQSLVRALNILVPGAAVVINGEEKIFLEDQELGEKLISTVKEQYTPRKEDLKVVKVDLKEKVEIVEKEVPVKEIATKDQAYHILTTGAEKMITHTVESGESLWSIAMDNGMEPEELEKANPQMTGNKLQIGTEVNLVKMEPMVHVTAVAEFSEIKPVPFEVKVEKDDSMPRGKQKVTQEGKEGQKEFTYLLVQENGEQVGKQFVNGVVLAKPVNKIVVQGTKMVLASRGSGGSLKWPLNGPITSRFGNRRLGYHTGLDINGDTGDPVRAAEAGKVTYAGWDGSYGKIVRISHGNGAETWYAHLSAFEVGVGDEVDQGDLIAKVGNTGRSTGSHLHFEVRSNGNALNPLNYLN
ncbi:M23 family metallopeptidase [Dehalobacterium formicoaceticum]|uniref:Peptidoglycan DD-metalloendopeptidase family protein n=1 Tax=Dehalobacterium formicoaceticum TaxID=51515 RepID=A0ABT1Y5X3_9FIRM|nr:M23 family metallopeptidase [Dehalobacterium formicoaceticum]MCR6545515.1 peptidoglycan DD-metalloendopeptidase family protein [Dehalobacterium formicoaceticum]